VSFVGAELSLHARTAPYFMHCVTLSLNIISIAVTSHLASQWLEFDGNVQINNFIVSRERPHCFNVPERTPEAVTRRLYLLYEE